MKPVPVLAVALLSVGMLVSGCGDGGGTSTASPAVSATGGPLTDVSSLSDTEKIDKFVAAAGGATGNVSRDGLTTFGERACGAFAEGSSVDEVRDIFMRKGLTESQANKVLLAAAAILCPEYASKVNP